MSEIEQLYADYVAASGEHHEFLAAGLRDGADRSWNLARENDLFVRKVHARNAFLHRLENAA